MRRIEWTSLTVGAVGAIGAVGAALLLTAALAGQADAQAAGAGMAGAYGMRARGAEAPFWNPALLAWDRALHLQFLSLQASFNNNSFSLADYNRWNGERWDDATKTEILRHISGELLEGRAGMDAVIPGFAYDGWAVTVESRAVGHGEVTKELARLVLFGNTPDETYSLEGSDGLGMAYTAFRLSNGYEVAQVGDWDLAVGGTVKYIRGWAYGEVTRASGEVITTDEFLRGDGVFEELTSLGGNGFGLDLGAAARSSRGFMAGVSVRNAIGSMHWSRDVKMKRQIVDADSVNLDELEDDPDLIVTETFSEDARSFHKSFTPVLDVAVAGAYRDFYLEADLRQGFEDGLESTTTPRFALGAAYPFWPWFEGRTGFAVGGLDGPVLALGSGFAAGRVLIDVTFRSSGDINPFSGKGLGFGLSVGLR